MPDAGLRSVSCLPQCLHLPASSRHLNRDPVSSDLNQKVGVRSTVRPRGPAEILSGQARVLEVGDEVG